MSLKYKLLYAAEIVTITLLFIVLASMAYSAGRAECVV